MSKHLNQYTTQLYLLIRAEVTLGKYGLSFLIMAAACCGQITSCTLLCAIIALKMNITTIGACCFTNPPLISIISGKLKKRATIHTRSDLHVIIDICPNVLIVQNEARLKFTCMGPEDGLNGSVGLSQ